MDNLKLVKSSKIIDRVLKIIQGFMAAGVIVCAVFIPLILIFGEKMLVDEGSVELGYLTVQMADVSCMNGSMIRAIMIPALILSGVMCGVVWYGLRVLRQIFAPLKEGRPFEQGISGQIRKMAWIALIGGAFCEIGNAVIRVYELRMYDLSVLFNADMVAGFTYKIMIDGGFLVLALVLFLLAHVFRYGELLQKESDETL